MTALTGDNIGSTLTDLARSTAEELDGIWKVVGYSQDEKERQLATLMEDFKSMCSAKISEEKGVADQFQKSIEAAKEEMVTTSSALKIDFDRSILTKEGESLTDTLSGFESALEDMRAMASKAKEQLIADQEVMLDMHRQLGTEMPADLMDISSDLTTPRLNSYRAAKDDLTEIYNTRTSAITQLVLDCQHLIQELCIEAENSELDRKIMGSITKNEGGLNTLVSTYPSETCTGITSSAFEELTTRVGELNAEKRRRKQKLGELGAEIAMLWEKLKVGEDIQKAFTDSVQGLGMDTLMKGEVEVKRLHGLKREKLGELILEARETIKQLWEETNASQQQRDAFTRKQTTDKNDFTDETLELHDEEIQVLQARLDTMQPMLKMIEKREEVLVERVEYEELQKDPDRLKQRGGALTKQLMKEEKMQKRIKKDLPKYTDILSKKLREWEKECGEKFFWKGRDYAVVMAEQEQEWQAKKDAEAQKKLEKKQQEKARMSGIGGVKKLPGAKGKRGTLRDVN